MQVTESSETDFKEPDRRARSSPPGREAAPARSDGLDAGVLGAYLELFGRPPLGGHPELDGYAAGRTLAKEYPSAMMEVMSGFRQGVEEIQKSGEAGGECR